MNRFETYHRLGFNSHRREIQDCSYIVDSRKLEGEMVGTSIEDNILYKNVWIAYNDNLPSREIYLYDNSFLEGRRTKVFELINKNESTKIK